MKNKLKYIDEWAIDKASKKIVKKELRQWIKEFIKRGDDPAYTVRECDFKNDRLFFFTKCHDILEDGKERPYSMRIRKRKRQVLMSLFLKQLIGDKIEIKRPLCSHCGRAKMSFDHVNGGFVQYCTACNRIIVDTEAHTYGTACMEASEKLSDYFG